MTTRIAINGFGRIGKLVYRAALDNSDIEIVAVNNSSSAEQNAHLLKYDSVHGRLNADIKVENDMLNVNGMKTKVINERDPQKLPWADLGIDLVMEASGKLRDANKAKVHLENGAQKVLITAPGKNVDLTVVLGVNEQNYDFESHHIVSAASCTTNCLAPLVKVLHEEFTIEHGLMTTVHSYTNDQRTLDGSHKDMRRARAANLSMIPTTTGAAKSVAQVLPELNGKLNGFAVRVPTPDVSLVDLVVKLNKNVSAQEVNQSLLKAAEGPLKGIMGYTEEPLVSSDFTTDPRSCIVDGLSTMAIGEGMVKVLAWYDNEWAYSCRLVELAQYMMENNKTQSRRMIS